MRINEIQTPALVLFKNELEYNMNLMDHILKDSNMSLYPHYKSNKCPGLVKMQLERGAQGVTCAKLYEAIDLADNGVKKIIIANQIVQAEKLPILARLASVVDLTVCADNADNILALESACAAENSVLKVLVEYEVGMNRCGVDTKEEFLELACLIMAQPHLRFEGIQAYAGHISHEKNSEFRLNEVLRIEKRVADLKSYLEENGFYVRSICGGSTGFAADKPKDTVYTQFQAGSYLFMDSSYEKLNTGFHKSLFVLTTVISVKPDRFVVDAGVKTMVMDQDPPYFADFPDAEISFSEEHMAVSVKPDGIALGSKQLVVPGHCCTTMNIFDKVYIIDNDEVTAELPIVSRGKAQ